MIKFFRRIRQTLLSENKFSKYLLYAIGEIVLVVIGILIALQINNWNEQRKAAIEEKEILQNLYENLTLASQQSEALIAQEKELKELLIRILGIDFNTGGPSNNTLSDVIFKQAVWDLQSNLPIVNSYFNLKNTNKLSLIKDKEINGSFTDFEFRLKKLNDALEDRLSVHQIRIDDVFEKDVNFLLLIKSNISDIDVSNEIPNDYSKILSNQRVRNLLGMKLDFTHDVIDYREELDNAIKELITLISSELKDEGLK